MEGILSTTLGRAQLVWDCNGDATDTMAASRVGIEILVTVSCWNPPPPVSVESLGMGDGKLYTDIRHIQMMTNDNHNKTKIDRHNCDNNSMFDMTFSIPYFGSSFMRE